jgi:hypothetical protein
MNISIYSFRYGVEIMSNPPYNTLYNEILETCRSCPVPVYPAKSENQAGKDVVQQILNQYIKLSLTQKGWSAEPEASPDDVNDALRFDFEKDLILEDSESLKVRVEVEFGNAASYYRDLYKFQRAFTYKNADICILILPMNRLCTRIDSGLANFEKAKRELPDSILSTTVPIIVIGLENDTDSEFDLSEYMYVPKIAKDTNKEYVLLRDIFLKAFLKHEADSTVPLLNIDKKFESNYLQLLELIATFEKNRKKLLQLQEKIDSYTAELSTLTAARKRTLSTNKEKYAQLDKETKGLSKNIDKLKIKLGISEYI